MVQNAEDAEMPKDKVTLHVLNLPLQRYAAHLENHMQTLTSFTRQGLYETRIATCHLMCLMLGDRSMKSWSLAVCSQGCCTTSKASFPVSKCCINLPGSVCFACFSRLSFKQLIMCSWAVLLLQSIFHEEVWRPMLLRLDGPWVWRVIYDLASMCELTVLSSAC